MKNAIPSIFTSKFGFKFGYKKEYMLYSIEQHLL